jgi:hypothetical protein
MSDNDLVVLPFNWLSAPFTCSEVVPGSPVEAVHRKVKNGLDHVDDHVDIAESDGDPKKHVDGNFSFCRDAFEPIILQGTAESPRGQNTA